MRYVVALSASVALTFFWIGVFYYMRQNKYEDWTIDYKSWWDYLYVYGCVVACAGTSLGISHTIGA